jgi:hypothetical protein
MATTVTTTVTTPETAMAAESTPAEAAAAESTPTEAASAPTEATAAPAEVGIIVRNGKHGRALRRGEAS